MFKWHYLMAAISFLVLISTSCTTMAADTPARNNLIYINWFTPSNISHLRVRISKRYISPAAQERNTPGHMFAYSRSGNRTISASYPITSHSVISTELNDSVQRESISDLQQTPRSYECLGMCRHLSAASVVNLHRVYGLLERRARGARMCPVDSTLSCCGKCGNPG